MEYNIIIYSIDTHGTSEIHSKSNHISAMSGEQ